MKAYIRSYQNTGFEPFQLVLTIETQGDFLSLYRRFFIGDITLNEELGSDLEGIPFGDCRGDCEIFDLLDAKWKEIEGC